MSENVIPKSQTSWQMLASRYGVLGIKIHDVEQPKSGSKLGLDQFLTFRAIYHDRSQSNFKNNMVHQFIDHEYLEDAREHLISTPSWLNYIQAIENIQERRSQISKQDLGSYYSTMDWQYEVSRRRESSTQSLSQAKIDISPISKRTRSKQTVKASGSPSLTMKRLTGMMASNLTLEETARPSDWPRGLEAFTPPPSRAQGTSQLYETPESPGPVSPAQKEDMPTQNDEQIVNSALLTFLRCLIGYKRVPKAQWDFTRHRLTFENIPAGDTRGCKVYSADTDGVLRAEDGLSILAIIEVKPYVRSHDLNSIRMQETAQMVAWIREDAQEQHDWKRFPNKV
ncbi:MAG: hypothetical protein Q9157_005592 [Trypethelium eluteriae]